MNRNITQEQAEAIFRDYSPQIYRAALFLTKSPTLADDITQDTFIQVFRKYHSYDPAKPLLPWIYKIALNMTRKTFRKQKWPFLSKEVPDNESHNYVEDVVLKNEQDEELWKEINKLTLKGREIIVMHYYSGFKLSEIATALGIPLGTCKSRLNAALNSLGKQLHCNTIMMAIEGEDVYETI